MTKSKNRARKRAKFYYSWDPHPRLYWWVKVKPAAKSVTLNGTLAHAIQGYPGTTIGCHLSNCASDKKNKSAFPHPCLMAAFTATTALILTKIKDGSGVEAVEYHHSYRWLVELNDKKTDNSFIEQHPELFDREFVLRPWKKHKRRGGVATGTSKPRPKIASYANYGALLRSQKAGLITRPVAEAIKQMAA